MFFSRRPHRGRDRFLPVKLATLVVGGVLGLVGMRLENSLLVSVAIAVVLVGFLLRFVRDPGPEMRDQGSEGEHQGAESQTPHPGSRAPDPVSRP